MHYLITITYRQGKKAKTLAYIGTLEKALCHQIALSSCPQLAGVSWSQVLSVSIVPEPKE